MTLVDAVALFLAIVSIVSFIITEMINIGKPVIFDKILNDFGIRAYLGSILFTRAFIAAGIFLFAGGANIIYDQIPQAEAIPEFMIVLGMIAVSTAGSGAIHRISDLTNAVYGNVKPTINTDAESIQKLQEIAEAVGADTEQINEVLRGERKIVAEGEAQITKKDEEILG